MVKILGPEKKTKIPDEEANTITAYHEGGHAIVAYFTKDSHPLHKVTIMPRGSSLGHVCIIILISKNNVNVKVLCLICKKHYYFIDGIYTCKGRIPCNKI